MDRRLTPGAIRQRLYRQRRRDNVQVLAIPVDAFGLVDALITAGRLDEAASEDRTETAAAIGKLLEEWRFSVMRDGSDPLRRATLGGC